MRFAKEGIRIGIGSRSAERARDTARELNARVGGELIAGGENRDVISSADIIFLTVPFREAPAVLDTYRQTFRDGSILVDTTVPVTFEDGKARLIELPEGSGSEFLAGLLPQGVACVGAFKTIPAHMLADLGSPLSCDAFVFGNSKAAKERVMEMIGRIQDLRPVDAGDLSAARTLERMTLLAIGINRRYKIKSARYRIVGL